MQYQLSETELKNLAPGVYRFKGIDNSPVAKWLSPKWDALVRAIIPTWMAPNVLTVTGAALLVINIVLLASYRPELGTSVPRWVWLFCAFNSFWSYALDCMDGKQARRTSSSSALGELMDHGCDAFAIWMITYCMGMLTRFSEEGPLGEGWTIMFWLVISLWNFSIAHWESYNTHTFYLPWSFDIGEISVVSVYLLSYAFGPTMWYVPLHTLCPDSAAYLPNFQLREGLTYLTLTFVIIDTLRTLFVIARVEKPNGWLYAMEPLLVLVYCFGSVCIFAAALSHEIFITNITLVVTLLGFIFCQTTTRIVLAHVAEAPLNANYAVFFPPLVAAADIYIARTYASTPLFSEMHHIYIQIAFAALSFFDFAIGSTRQFCKKFDISCFSIKPKSN